MDANDNLRGMESRQNPVLHRSALPSQLVPRAHADQRGPLRAAAGLGVEAGVTLRCQSSVPSSLGACCIALAQGTVIESVLVEAYAVRGQRLKNGLR